MVIGGGGSVEADGDGDGSRALLSRIFARVTARIDGQRLVAAAAAAGDPTFAAATHVLAVGKVALPMLRGLPPDAEGRRRRALAVVPGGPPSGGVPPPSDAAIDIGMDLVHADHPRPGARSVAAAVAALDFVRATDVAADSGGAPARLLVLLSGGASSLLCAPAEGIAWTDKRDAIEAVARAGATIRELNVVRKHLSAIKGGRLALATRAPIAVCALSDVIGDDPATIGSGPFSADPSFFSDALAITDRLGAPLPVAARDRLQRGARGQLAETPKPGSSDLDHVTYRILAGPARVVAEARQAALDEGVGLGPAALPVDGEETVEDLAERILAVARQASVTPASVAGGAGGRVFVGNGEPRVVLATGGGGAAAAARPGRGGRATHLALLVARGLAALPDPGRARVAFLAAGTDDRDGDSDVSGAIVDGWTWALALALGLDPDRALRGFDSLPVLAATGATIRGPGTSNLLDLHLLLLR